MSSNFRLTAFFLFISFATFNLHSQNPYNPFKGEGRYGAVEFVIGDTVYIGLGQDKNQHYNTFRKYSAESGNWEPVADFPGSARSNAIAFSIKGKAYVGLGNYYVYGVADTIFRDFYSYNPENNTWTKLNDFGGGERTNTVCFVLNDTAYIGTGAQSGNKQTKDFWKYNVSTDSWSMLSPEFSGDSRYGASAFTVNGKAYVTGGGNFTGYYLQLSDVQEYDPATNTWTEKLFADGINLSFNNATAFGYGGKGYICYGSKNIIASYNPQSNEVENLGNVLNLEDKRLDPISFVLKDTAYFGLGLYYKDDGSPFGQEVYDSNILKLDLPNPGFPVGLTLSNDTIQERLPENSLVGYFNTITDDPESSFTYSLVNPEQYPDNALFSINGSSLLVSSLDYSSHDTLRILIKTTNSNIGSSLEKEFSILVKENIPEGINPFAGTPRHEAVSFTIGDTVYIGLGRTDNSEALDDFWKYTKSTNTWQRMEPFPGGKRTGSVTFTIGNIAYVGLGYDGDYFNMQRDFYSFNPETNTWMREADFPGEGRALATSFTLDSIAVVGSGNAYGDQFNDYWQYNPKTNEWTKTTDFSGSKRTGAVGFTIDNKGYVAGGYYTVNAKLIPISDLHEYDPETGNWKELITGNNHLAEVMESSVFVMNNKAYFCYGVEADQLFVFDPDSNSVSSFGDLLDIGNRLNPVSFVLEDTAYLGLGISNFYDSKDDILKVVFPESPTDIFLSNLVIQEKNNYTSFIGEMSAIDNSINTTHTYSLINGENYPDNRAFKIIGSKLYSNTVFDYEEQNTYNINIQVVNNYDSAFTKDFTITIEDEDENLNSVDTKNSDKLLILFPNPVESILHIVPQHENNTVRRIEIYNVSGSKIGEYTGVNQVDLSETPRGLYYVRITNEDKTYLNTIVKK